MNTNQGILHNLKKLLNINNNNNISKIIDRDLDILKKIYINIKEYKYYLNDIKKFINLITKFNLVDKYQKLYNNSVKKLTNIINNKIRKNNNINNINNINKLVNYYKQIYNLHILKTNNLKKKMLNKYFKKKSNKIMELSIELSETIKLLLYKKNILKKLKNLTKNNKNINNIINIKKIKNKLFIINNKLDYNNEVTYISNNIKKIKLIIYLKKIILNKINNIYNKILSDPSFIVKKSANNMVNELQEYLSKVSNESESEELNSILPKN